MCSLHTRRYLHSIERARGGMRLLKTNFVSVKIPQVHYLREDLHIRMGCLFRSPYPGPVPHRRIVDIVP